MSLGIGGFGRIFDEDANMIIYEYGGYDLDNAQYRNRENLCDGYITIYKSCLPPRKVYEKIKRINKKRKEL